MKGRNQVIVTPSVILLSHHNQWCHYHVVFVHSQELLETPAGKQVQG